MPKRSRSSIENHLAEELECPICTTLMRPPIYQCEEGHTVCNKCHKKIDKCPTCRCKMKSKIRNRALEKVAQEMKFPCSLDGCGLQIEYSKLQTHEKKCGFRPIPCLLCDADENPFEGSQAEIISHLADEHDLEPVRASQKTTFTEAGDEGEAGTWARLYKWVDDGFDDENSRYLVLVASPFCGTRKKAMQFQLFCISQGGSNYCDLFFRLSMEDFSKSTPRKSEAVVAVLDFRDRFHVGDANDALVVPTEWMYWLCSDDDNTDEFTVSIEIVPELYP